MSVDDFMELIGQYGSRRAQAEYFAQQDGLEAEAKEYDLKAKRIFDHIRTNLEGLYESFNEGAQ